MYVLGLGKIESGSRLFGEKAKHLSEMMKQKMPVPDGFAVNTEALSAFLKQRGIESKIRDVVASMDFEDFEQLSKASESIRELLLNTPIPPAVQKEIEEAYNSMFIPSEAKKVGGAAYEFIKAGRDKADVAVRCSPVSGGDSSFAGQTESVLNVSGLQGILSSVRFCWASLYTPRALYYRKRRGFSDIPMAGVIVEKMINSEKSGNIIPMDNRVIIESSWGLGGSIQYGIVSPDRYVIDRDSGEIVEKDIGKKNWQYRKDALTGRTIKEVVSREKVNEPTLTDFEATKIFELYSKVSESLKSSGMIEFGVERGRVYFLQSRPIKIESEEAEEPDGKVLVKGVGVSPRQAKGSIKIIANNSEFGSIDGESIIATKILSPEFVPFVGKAKAIVSQYGGISSSLSLICRELNIPCVVGVDFDLLRNDQQVLVSGNHGKVFVQETEVPQNLPLPQPVTQMHQTHDAEQIDIADSGSVTGTEVLMNIRMSRPEDWERDCDGGIITSESLLRDQDPSYLARSNPEELTRTLEGVEAAARRFYPKTVWLRSYAGHRPAEGPPERNPILGLRGVRRTLKEPDILRCEAEAVKNLYSRGLHNIGIILPFVSGVDEFRAARAILPRFVKTGIEISVPSALMDIDSFSEADFILINLPELAEFILGADRRNPKVAGIYSEHHPAVAKFVEDALRKSRGAVSVYMERLDPSLMERFVKAGASSIILEPENIESAKTIISRIERRMLLSGMSRKESAPAKPPEPPRPMEPETSAQESQSNEESDSTPYEGSGNSWGYRTY